MKENINWRIDVESNHCVCSVCGGIMPQAKRFLPAVCNAHTHGMEAYNHLDFQIVLDFKEKELHRILNAFALKVQAGQRFAAGDYVAGIYSGGNIRLDEAEEDGRKVLRIVIPDKNNKFPEDVACTGYYRLQALATKDLSVESGALPMVRVYQILATDETQDIVFESLRKIKERRKCDVIPAEWYKRVFEGSLGTDDLEEIFCICNESQPNGYEGHSMSTSDVVELDYGAQDLFFFCDSVGFEAIYFDKTKVGKGV